MPVSGRQCASAGDNLVQKVLTKSERCVRHIFQTHLKKKGRSMQKVQKLATVFLFEPC